ncbi:VOC family protein [Jiella marina]|uniref:VOC family protein n=1 Tax=Jiella sp. LLJ827 TaxID=2917712 RepID=UPI00210140AC|nr:VOC family protein [Jiella sp. LLJ827]MCQ0989712.1 VOC family protein [Jiella sp. LLJ827]
MSHRSRLGCIVVDCQTRELGEALEFWSGLFGCSGKVDEDGKYAVLKMPDGEPKVLIQAVDHAPRVHLDIETDDRQAEARRLEALGAKRVEAVKSWIVMEAPTGQRFCLVPPQRQDFEENARRFED